MLAATVIKNTVTKRLWNFQIRFLPYSNAFEKKFFFQTCSFIIIFNFVPDVISRKCLPQPLLKTRLLSAFGIFKSVSCLIRMRLKKIFFPNMFFYHFLQLCPRGHIAKMLAATVIKNTVTKRLWNFQIRFLPYSNAFEKKFFFQTCSFIIFFNFVTEVISRKCLLQPLLKTRILSAFGIFKSVSCLIRMRLRKNFFSKHVLLSFSSTLSPKSYRENACCNRY